jgi:hypothetical protein
MRSSLALFMPGILTDNSQFAVAPDNLAFIATLFQ